MGGVLLGDREHAERGRLVAIALEDRGGADLVPVAEDREHPRGKVDGDHHRARLALAFIPVELPEADRPVDLEHGFDHERRIGGRRNRCRHRGRRGCRLWGHRHLHRTGLIPAGQGARDIFPLVEGQQHGRARPHDAKADHQPAAGAGLAAGMCLACHDLACSFRAPDSLPVAHRQCAGGSLLHTVPVGDKPWMDRKRFRPEHFRLHRFRLGQCSACQKAR